MPAIPLSRASPRKNFVKICGWCSAGMPIPWSRTWTVTSPSVILPPDLDEAAVRGVLDGVAEQVREDLREPVTIAAHGERVLVDRELDPVLRDLVGDELRLLDEERLEIERLRG